MDNRRNRPRKPEAVTKKSQLGMRVRSVLREKLEAAAEKNHRSLSEEAEARLEKSFDLEAQMGTDTLEMAGAFTSAGQRAAVISGHPEWVITGEWRLDENCFEAAIYHASKILWRQHPTRVGETWQKSLERLNKYLAGLFGVSGSNLLSSEYDDGQRDRDETITSAHEHIVPLPQSIAQFLADLIKQQAIRQVRG